MARMRRSAAEALSAINRNGIRIELDEDGEVFAAYSPGSHRSYHKGTIGSFLRRGLIEKRVDFPVTGRRGVSIGEYYLTESGHAALNAA